MYGREAFETGKTILSRARSAQLSFLAASLAYYMLVSLFPLALLAFVVATAVGGEAFAARVMGTVAAFLSPSGAALLEGALAGGAGRGGVTVAGLALLVWGGLRVFRGLDVAFTLAYGESATDSLGAQLLDAAVALGGIVAAVVTLVATNVALTAAGFTLSGTGATVLLVGPLFVAFYPFYYLFPDVPMSPRAAVPGALFAAIGWTVLGATFSIYAANAGSFALYGAVGAVLLLVTWFYLAGLVLLVGAVVNAVLDDVAPPAPGDALGALGEADRQRLKAAGHSVSTMPEEGTGRDAADVDPEEVRELRAELEELREEVDEKSLPKDELEGDLRQYVRARVRRGKARGWGPYLVLLYGTAMTIAAFHYLDDLAAVFAMVVIWLSTLGLYALMVLIGTAASALAMPGKAVDRLRDFRR